MRKIVWNVAAVAALSVAAPAAAQVVPATVTGSGNYQGDVAILTDGVFPTDGSPYNEAGREVSFDDSGSFTFDFGGTYSIDSLVATVDNNDTYVFDLFNGAALTGHLVIGAGEGSVGNGVETFTRFFGPVTATSAIVSATGGDHLNALGEVQFRSEALTAAAVPEPATWAMMLLGFGAIGFQARRQRSTLNEQAA